MCSLLEDRARVLGVRGGGSCTSGSCRPVTELTPALASCSLACCRITEPGEGVGVRVRGGGS